MPNPKPRETTFTKPSVKSDETKDEYDEIDLPGTVINRVSTTPNIRHIG